MIDKSHFKKFFSISKILTEQEFDAISDYCGFDMQMPNKNNNNVIVEISNEKPIPLEIYIKCVKSIPKLVIRFASQNNCQDEVLLDQYIQYLCQQSFANNKLLCTLLLKDNYSLSDCSLDIKYFTQQEKKQLIDAANTILIFLQEVGFKISKIKFVFNEVKQSKVLIIEKEKQKMVEVALNSIPKQLDGNAKLKKENAIKGKITHISSLGDDFIDTYVNLEGEIFSVNVRETRSKSKIYTFEIFDYNNGAISLVYVLSSTQKINTNSWSKNFVNLTSDYLNEFKIGDWVQTNCKIASDKYTRFEITGKIKTICSVDKPKSLIVTDDESKKRTELLIHSKKTSFDGICDADEICKYTKSLGHSAIGILERFNVQSIPEIVSACKKNKIKPLYGCEFELTNKITNIVINPKPGEIDKSTYVLFDIETTGLYNEFEELIEFGAIKYCNGMILDHINIFVKPSKSLSNKIIKLTHITNDMLDDALSPKEALKQITTWIGNDVLIAHNGINFDFEFLNKLLFKNKMPLLTNTLIDTMQLSRAINKDTPFHSLGRLCRSYKILYNEEEAHRADKDAEYLMYVWQKMIKLLANNNITDIKDINSLQNSWLRASQFGFIVDVYVKNQQGIKDLYKLVSLSLTDQLYCRDDDNKDDFYGLGGKPRIHYEDLMQYKQNLIICPHPYEGEIWDAALNKLDNVLEEKILFYDYIFLAPIKNIEHLIAYEEITEKDAKKAIKRIIESCNKLNKKICAVSDAYYTSPYNKIAHEVYVHTKQLAGKRHRLYRHGQSITIPDFHYLTTKEMMNEFSFLHDEKLIENIVINNCNDLVGKVEENLVPIKTKLYQPNIPGSDKQLIELVYSNAKKLYGDKIPELIQKRLEKELGSIVGNKYDVVYWISHLLTKQSKDDGYVIGSRGSVGSSLIAYLADISEVNPLPPHYLCHKCQYFEYGDETQYADGYDLPGKNCPHCKTELLTDGHNIPFETFLGFHGEKVPDIDLNFSGEYQSKAHDFIRKIFGADRAFRAGTISTVAQKTAYGYVRNYFEEINDTIQRPNSYINYLVSKCIDVKRTTGQHPGGIIVIPKEYDIFDFAPYNFPADDKHQNYSTHFDFNSMHDSLLKFDILGHDNPKTLKLLKDITGIDPEKIGFNDAKVMEQFNSSKELGIIDSTYDVNTNGAIGLPEFGTNFVRKLLKDANPKTIADLIRISGLSHGTDVWAGNAYDLITKANLTLDKVISCRDDIMVFLISQGIDSLTAFNIMEAIRKGRGLTESQEKTLRDNNIPDWYIESCKKIQYLFPKAHATAYVIMSWRFAWFKQYYPLEFYANHLSVRADAFDIETITKGRDEVKKKFDAITLMLKSPEADKVKSKDKDLLYIYALCLELFARGFTISNIDINKSAATEFLIAGKAIIPPFKTLDGLGDEAAKSIVAARSVANFTSVDDLLNRTKINSTCVSKLQSLGVLNDLDQDDQMKLF